jgi:hypothetical protein
MASLGTWPSTVGVKSARFDLQTNQRVGGSPFGGSEQVVDMLNDRWMCYLTLPVELFAQAAAVEAFLTSFRGMVNTVDLWHFAREAPRGTLRGTLLTSGTQAQGAASLVLTGGTPGGTLLAGDLLGAGGQILMVAPAGATADGAGNITVPLVNRLRASIATGQSVTWDKPKAPFRMLAHTGLLYERGITGEVQCTLGEAIG